MGQQITPLSMTLDKTGITNINPDACAISPDGKIYALGLATSPYLALFDTTTTPWTRLALPNVAPGSTVKDLAFSPDSSRCVIILNSPYVILYDTTTTPWTSLTLNNIPSLTTSVRFNKSGTRCVIGYNSSPYIRIFDTTTTPWTQVTGPATALSTHPVSGGYFIRNDTVYLAETSNAVWAYDTTVTPWTRITQTFLPGTHWNVFGVSPSEDFLVIRVNGSPYFRVYDITQDPPVALPDPISLPTSSLGSTNPKFSPDGRFCFLAGYNGEPMFVYDTTTTPWTRVSNPSVMPTAVVRDFSFTNLVGGQLISARIKHTKVDVPALISKDNNVLMVGLHDSSLPVAIYDAMTYDSIPQTTYASIVVADVAVSPDGKKVAIIYGTSNPSSVVIYDLDGGVLTNPVTIVSPGSTLNIAVSWSLDGRFLAVTRQSNVFFVFNTTDWSQITLGTTTAAVDKCLFTSDSSKLICGNTTALYYYDTATWTRNTISDYPTSYISSSGNIRNLAIDHKTGMIACGLNAAPFLALYDQDFNLLPLPTACPTSLSYAVSFSPDGSKLLVSVGSAPFIYAYNVADMSPITLNFTVNTYVYSISWTKHGDLVALALYNNPYLMVIDTNTWLATSYPAISPGVRCNVVSYGVIPDVLKPTLLMKHIKSKVNPASLIYEPNRSGTYSLNQLSNLPTDQAWNTVICDATGTYVYVGAPTSSSGYYNKKSSNGGVSFSDMATMSRCDTSWVLCCSDDGKHILALPYTGTNLNISSDYGQTFSVLDSTKFNGSVSCNALAIGGKVQFIDRSSGTSFYITRNGYSYQQYTSPHYPVRAYMDSCGQYLLLSTNTNGKWLSKDFGYTWSQLSSNTSGGCTMSRNGKFILYWASSGSISKSSDYGANFSTIAGGTGTNLLDAAISDDGKIILLCYAAGIQLSTDGGASFSTITSAISTSGWGGRVALSRDGKIGYMLNTTNKTLYKYTET